MYKLTRAAVLIFAYKRVDSLTQILEVLLSDKERNIYISIDSDPETSAPNAQVLQLVRDFADYSNHNVKVWTYPEHLGLQRNCKNAIHNFFSLENIGIVLDDDIIPTKAFFASLDAALEVFAENQDIYFVNGWTPFLANEIANKPYFTEYFVSWGWASWSSKILKLSFDMVEAKKDFWKSWKPFGYYHNLGFRPFWLRRYYAVSSSKSRSWDWELLFSLWTRKGKVVSVHERLCTNIGYDSHASHPNNGSKRQIATARNISVLEQNYWREATFRPRTSRRNEALMWDLGLTRIRNSMIYRISRLLSLVRQD